MLLIAATSGAFASGAPAAAQSSRWRIYISDVGSNGYPSLAEVEMRSGIGGADIAIGGAVSASSNWGADYPANAFDDNLTTFWAGGVPVTTSASWLEYTFASSVAIREISLSARNDTWSDQAPRDFELQYWDGTAWLAAISRLAEPAWGVGEQRIYSV